MTEQQRVIATYTTEEWKAVGRIGDDVRATLIQGDCLEVMPHLPEQSIDCIITDPPYG